MKRKPYRDRLLAIIVGAVLVVAGGSFWYYQQSVEQNKSTPWTQVAPESSSSATPSAPVEQVNQNAIPEEPEQKETPTAVEKKYSPRQPPASRRQPPASRPQR